MSVEFVGPFQSHVVVVEGWKVPLVEANLLPGGRVNLVLDNRFGLDLTVSEAERFVPFLAEAIAVAMGFTSHPSKDEKEPHRALHPLQPVRVTPLLTEAEQS